MPKKARVPRPPVQAPKRRDSRRSSFTLPRWAWAAIGAVAGVIVIVVIVLVTTGGSGISLPLAPLSTVGPLIPAPAAGPAGPEGVPIPKAPPLALPGYLKPGATLDGISCNTTEMLTYHIHAHLTIFVSGAARQVPLGIGIAPPRQYQSTSAGRFVVGGSCFAWLHTHASDGIVHIESPSAATYTLGDFFDIWHQPLSRNQVGPERGKITAFFDGKVYTGSVRDIPLLKHAQIQLDVGTPLIAPEQISFPDGL